MIGDSTHLHAREEGSGQGRLSLAPLGTARRGPGPPSQFQISFDGREAKGPSRSISLLLLLLLLLLLVLLVLLPSSSSSSSVLRGVVCASAPPPPLPRSPPVLLVPVPLLLCAAWCRVRVCSARREDGRRQGGAGRGEDRARREGRRRGALRLQHRGDRVSERGRALHRRARPAPAPAAHADARVAGEGHNGGGGQLPGQRLERPPRAAVLLVARPRLPDGELRVGRGRGRCAAPRRRRARRVAVHVLQGTVPPDGPAPDGAGSAPALRRARLVRPPRPRGPPAPGASC